VSGGSTLALATYSFGNPTSLVLECNETAGSSITGTGGILTLGGNMTVNNLNTSQTGATISCPVILGTAVSTFAVSNDGPAENDLTINGPISGSYGITKTGAGSMLLNYVNQYTGITLINGGTIKLGAEGGDNYSPLGTGSSGTTVNSGSTLDLNGYTIIALEELTIDGGSLANNGAIAATYPGSVVLMNSSSINTLRDITWALE
jgi:autotransporter-associated beta strand protein